MLEAISKVQVYFENDIHMDHNIEWFILTTLHVIHVYRPVFQRKSEFCGFRNARGHLLNNILRDYNNYTIHEFSIRCSILQVLEINSTTSNRSKFELRLKN